MSENENEVAGEQQKGSGLAVASLVCGILGFCVPLANVAALITGIMALVKKTAGRGMAIAGTILGGVSLLMAPIMLAIMIPAMLGARQSVQETGAIGSLISYGNAQVMYHKNDWNADGVLSYAVGLRELCDTEDGVGNQIGLIDASFAAATSPARPKNGYYFTVMQTIGGQPIDLVSDFALCASPAVYGKTGRRTFIIGSDGVIYGKDLGKDASPPDDYPENPVQAGWVEVR